MYTKNILSMYSKSILIVDDVPFFLKMAADCFRREQIDITTAKGGLEAISVTRKIKFDLIIMDLYMPGCDGDEACREIKGH
jgi:CheY-like chemotaxis protein